MRPEPEQDQKQQECDQPKDHVDTAALFATGQAQGKALRFRWAFPGFLVTSGGDDIVLYVVAPGIPLGSAPEGRRHENRCMRHPCLIGSSVGSRFRGRTLGRRPGCNNLKARVAQSFATQKLCGLLKFGVRDRLVIALDQSSVRMPAIVLRWTPAYFFHRGGHDDDYSSPRSTTSRRVSGKQNSASTCFLLSERYNAVFHLSELPGGQNRASHPRHVGPN